MFNLLPGLSAPKASSATSTNGSTTHLPNGTSPRDPDASAAEHGNELARAMAVKTNDQLMNIYLSSLIRAITAFHDLIENKIQNRQRQEEGDKEGDEKAVNGEAAESGKEGEKAGEKKDKDAAKK